MKQRLLHILNIKVSESRQVFDLVTIQFFIGLANAFVNIVAFTLFVYNLSIHQLPLAYLAIAGMLIILNVVYEVIEHLFSPLNLLKVVIGASALLLIPVWFGLTFWDKSSFIFILLVWSILIYMATGYAFWGLVSLMFNVRESKRVFSVAGAGDIPAKLIGYLAAPVLIPFLGLTNLIWVSVISLATGFILFNNTIKKKRWDKIKARSHVSKHQEVIRQQKRDPIGFFFKNKLIFFISILSVLSYNVFNLVDYTFLSQVKIRYESIAKLAAFIATFFALGRFIAIILKVMITSRVIERLGIRACLLITPLALFVFCILFYLFGGNARYNIYIFGMMALLTEVLRSAIQEPVFFILFQPLKEALRLKGHMISKGYMLPPSLITVGVTLLLLYRAGINISILFTIKLLLVNLVIWAIVIIYIGKFYAKAVHLSIKKGTFNIDETFRYDQETIEILLKKIKEGSQIEVIYALDLLEKANYPNLQVLLEEQIAHGTRDTKKYALDRLELVGRTSNEVLKEQLSTEKDPEILQKMVAFLCKYDQGYLEKVSENLEAHDFNIRKVITISLLNQTEFYYLSKAGHEINSLIHSPNPSDKELAIAIISEVRHVHFTHAIERLLSDTDPGVKRAAIQAGCKLKINRLLPAFLDLLQTTSDRYLVLKGLQQYGDELFIDLQRVEAKKISVHSPDLIKIAGKINGPNSTKFLLAAMNQNVGSQEKVLHALWAKSYKPETPAEQQRTLQLLDEYLKNGSGKISDYYALPIGPESSLLRNAIHNEVKSDLISILKLCSIIYRKKEINRVLELFLVESGDKVYNAMEMLELVLPKKTAMDVNHIFDFVLDPQHSKKTVARTQLQSLFKKIFFGQFVTYNPWTKAVWLYSCWKNKETGLSATLGQIPDPTEHYIISETRDYVKKALNA
jgi:ATP:ADP antiporter, AAA family